MLNICTTHYRRALTLAVRSVATVLLTLLCVSPSANAATGELDTSFGGRGFRFGGTIGSFGTNLSAAMAIQADGKIVVAGRINSLSTAEFTVLRYTASGVLDPSFGNNGFVSTIVGLGGTINGVAIQADGKIVAVGTCANLTKTNFCLARFDPNGSLDTSFSGDGKVLVSIGTGNDSARAVALQPDGKIVVAGTCMGATNLDFCLARFNTDGSFDTTFGVLNSTISSLNTPGNGNGKVILNRAVDDDEANSIVLGEDGSFYVGGICGRGTGGGGVARMCALGLITFPSGTLGSKFLSNPFVTTDVGLGDVNVYAIALSPPGGIVLAGYCAPEGNIQFCLTRYFLNGSIDTSFGVAGLVVHAMGTQGDYGRALTVQPDGKQLVAGYCENDLRTSTDFCLARFNANGSFDATFYGDGLVTPVGPYSSQAHAVALDTGGRIVAAGVCDTTSANTLFDLCVARFFSAVQTANCNLNIDSMVGVSATTDSLLHLRTIRGLATAYGFNLDIDGDLEFTVQDSLIHARIAFGFIGSAVVNGITFNPSATRTTWSAIRNYLNATCGTSLPP